MSRPAISMTEEEFDKLDAETTAAAAVACGIKSEDIAMVCMNRPDFVEALLAEYQKAGLLVSVISGDGPPAYAPTARGIEFHWWMGRRAIEATAQLTVQLTAKMADRQNAPSTDTPQ